ncbi:hypothetical protein F5877DRAFT_73683, partial [Lentinula edodes]
SNTEPNIATDSGGSLNAALIDAFEQFGNLKREYEVGRHAWLEEAEVGVLTTVQRAEATEEALSVKLEEVDQMLAKFSSEVETELKELVMGHSAQAANVLLKAGIQLEIHRLVEMKLHEILLRSQSNCNISDYIALQKASLQILERVFHCLLSDSLPDV